MDIDTHEVLMQRRQNGTSYHFPGLVGGHCIGVDPYYLTHKFESWVTNPKSF